MGTTVKKMTAWQRSQIGTKESPVGSNNVIYNTHYYGQPVSGDGYAWCAAYQWDGFRQLGASELFCGGKKTAYVPTIDEWAVANGMTVQDPREGDLIIFDWNSNKIGDHIGYCVSATSTTITTIDGNCEKAVKEITRNRSTVLRIIRPKYDPEPSQSSGCNTESCPILAYLKTIIKGG